jgi:hypothetical protein
MSVISSLAKFTNKDGPALWPSGAHSQPMGAAWSGRVMPCAEPVVTLTLPDRCLELVRVGLYFPETRGRRRSLNTRSPRLRGEADRPFRRQADQRRWLRRKRLPGLCHAGINLPDVDMSKESVGAPPVALVRAGALAQIGAINYLAAFLGGGGVRPIPSFFNILKSAEMIVP